jgi:hypothetical protein
MAATSICNVSLTSEGQVGLRYVPLGQTYAVSTLSSTESQVQVKIRTAGALSKLYCYIPTGFAYASVVVIKTRVNGLDGGMSVATVANQAGVYIDT